MNRRVFFKLTGLAVILINMDYYVMDILNTYLSYCL